MQRGVEGGGPQAPRLALVEHGCVGVEAGVERVGTQQPGAEAVDGRHRAASAARAKSGRSAASMRARTRCLSSSAAFSVKVIARMRSTAMPSSSTVAANRSTITDVLPRPRAGGEQERTVAQLDGAALLRGQGHGWPARQTPG